MGVTVSHRGLEELISWAIPDIFCWEGCGPHPTRPMAASFVPLHPFPQNSSSLCHPSEDMPRLKGHLCLPM